MQLGVQASLLAAGSLDAGVLHALGRDRKLALRYLALEGHRALATNEDSLPPWMRSTIDRGVAARVSSATDALDLARHDRGLAPPPVFGTIDPRRHLDARVRPVAGALHRSTGRNDPQGLAELDDDEADGGPDLGFLSSPVGGGGPIGRLLARLLRPGRSRDGSGSPGADAPTHAGWVRPGAGRTMVSAVAPPNALDATEPTATTSHHYPEWDVHRRTYRDNWCHVVEDVADAGSAPPRLLDGAALRPVLARLGTGLTPCRRRRQGDDLDLDAMVDARIGVRTGAPHTDDVYIESLRRRRDLSVLLLLDVSGSAAEPGVGGRPVHEHQREAAALLVAALDGLGDRVGLYAFNSRGRTAVRVTRVKGFDDRLDGRVGQRLDALAPGAFTRLGAAVRHGSAVLDARGGTPRRLLVVLSDGFAYDHGYEGRYGEADARRALLEARRRGIGCLCLSVGADADPVALRRVFGATAHAALPSAGGLAATIGPLFWAALRSAEAQRRRAQRRARHFVDELAR